MKKFPAAIALAVLAFPALLRAEKITVATLNTILGDFARQVGGDKVEVIDIVKPGIDPHIFEPTPSDIRTVANARLVLACGLGIEPYLPNLEKAVGSGPRFLILGDSIDPIMGEAHRHDHGDHHDHDHSHEPAPDPHWWHSIANARIAVAAIRDALSQISPENAATFAANAAAYDEKLDALAKWIRVQIATIPPERRILVTSHESLGYLARDYGFTILSLEGFGSTDHPSSSHVSDLIQKIRGTGIRAIFAENIKNPKVLQEITRETGASLGGTLYVDSLSSGGEADTYEALMRHNIATITGAIQ